MSIRQELFSTLFIINFHAIIIHQIIKCVIMAKFNKKVFFYYFCRIFSALAIAALFVLPLGMTQINLTDSESISRLLFPYSVAFIRDSDFYAPVLQGFFYSIYFLPVTFVLLVTSVFVKKIPHKLLYAFVLGSLTIYLFCGISCLIICANTSVWLQTSFDLCL